MGHSPAAPGSPELSGAAASDDTDISRATTRFYFLFFMPQRCLLVRQLWGTPNTFTVFVEQDH